MHTVIPPLSSSHCTGHFSSLPSATAAVKKTICDARACRKSSKVNHVAKLVMEGGSFQERQRDLCLLSSFIAEQEKWLEDWISVLGWTMESLERPVSE